MEFWGALKTLNPSKRKKPPIKAGAFCVQWAVTEALRHHRRPRLRPRRSPADLFFSGAPDAPGDQNTWGGGKMGLAQEYWSLKRFLKETIRDGCSRSHSLILC